MDYTAIVKKSWEYTKKYKWLWIYGLILSTAASGSSFSGGRNFSSSSNFKMENIQKLFKNAPPDLPQKTTYVLGQTTNLIAQWFTQIPLTTWVIIILGIIISIVVGITVSIIIRTWAEGSLITGVDEADNGKTPTLLATAKSGLSNIKPLIIYGLIVLGVSMLCLFILALLAGIGILLNLIAPILMIIWFILIGSISILALMVIFVLFAITNIYAQRLIVLHKFTPWQAWKKGLNLSKGNFLPTLVMYLINSTIGCGVGCGSLLVSGLFLGIPGIIIIYTQLKDGFRIPSLPVILILGILFFLFILLNTFVNALFTVFKYSNWNLLVKEVIDKEKQI